VELMYCGRVWRSVLSRAVTGHPVARATARS